MAQHKPSQDDQARDIVGIDRQIHDLLMKRAALLRGLRAVAGPSQGLLRPNEDAAVLRRIVGRHHGDFPLRAVVRIWREILIASLPAETEYSVHVYSGENGLAFWDLARTYFGSTLPVTGHATSSAVVHACAEDEMACGVVPLPESAENVSPWWAQLAAAGEAGPRIVARLPLITNDGGRFEYPSAYAIASITQKSAGDDTAVLFLETAQELSRTRLQTLLKQVGIEARIIAAGQEAAKSATRELLLEAKGFIPTFDPRLEGLISAAGDAVLRAVAVGGYANPVDYTAQGSGL